MELTWYQCTRHTFASHWVMDGRPIEKLQEILGHSSVTVTERYAHLSPEMFNEADLAALAVDLGEPLVLPIKTRQGGQKGDRVTRVLRGRFLSRKSCLCAHSSAG